MSTEIRRSSNLWRLLAVAASIVRNFVLEARRVLAANWPGGQVDGSPAPRGDELDRIGTWMRIRRPMFGSAPLPDVRYRQILDDPFLYHSAEGTEAGLIRAVEALGYVNVRYMAWDELQVIPTWIPPLPHLQVAIPNHNAFGLQSDNFPTSWELADGFPPPDGLVNQRLRSLIQAIYRSKRASAKLCEIRVGEQKVVTQGWWDAGQDMGSIEFVGKDLGGGDKEFVVVRGT